MPVLKLPEVFVKSAKAPFAVLNAPVVSENNDLNPMPLLLLPVVFEMPD